MALRVVSGTGVDQRCLPPWLGGYLPAPVPMLTRPCLPLLAPIPHSVQYNCGYYTGSQMCDVIVALGRFGYRPPADVFDTFVRHITDHAHELSPAQTSALSDALTELVPGYLGGGADGHRQYDELQMRLRAVEVPARVLLRAIPGSNNGSGSGYVVSGSDGEQMVAAAAQASVDASGSGSGHTGLPPESTGGRGEGNLARVLV